MKNKKVYNAKAILEIEPHRRLQGGTRKAYRSLAIIVEPICSFFFLLLALFSFHDCHFLYFFSGREESPI